MLMREQVHAELVDHILPFWQGLRDDRHGGFYGQMDFDLQVNPRAEKGCILNSRILWFFSSAARQLGDVSLLGYAQHAYQFLQERCIDHQHAGVFWSVGCDGSVADATKHTYNQAFAIYALAAYYRAAAEPQALQSARGLFELIERRCTDSGGYLEAFSRDWRPASNEKLSENGVVAARTMNTLLHVLEGYAGLYEAAPDPAVEAAIRRILHLFCERVYHPLRRRQEVFFDLEYRSLLDLHSYGHDIEASWLLDWAAGLLGDEALSARVGEMTGALAAEVYKTAYREQSLYNECENGTDDTARIWWVQAEAVVGFLNAAAKAPQQPEYRRAAEEIWQYIRAHIVDPRPGGEWYWEVDAQRQPARRKDIVEPWKCPYHNGRMCLEVLQRL